MIVVRCKGGLGNQLFQYAAGRALAAHHGVELKVDPTWYHTVESAVKVRRSFDLPHFRITAGLATEDDLREFGVKGRTLAARGLGRLRRAVTGHRWWSFHEMGYAAEFERLGANTLLEGFFQHPRYLAGMEPLLRAEFELREEPPADVRDLAAGLKAGPSVCVQVRRADYAAQPESAAFHGLCGADYYHRAWQEMLRRVPEARAWVFTDDPGWARDQLAELRPVRIVHEDIAGPAFGHKFHVMRACRHFITANSTFGWWAAWLGASAESVVVVPRAWLRDRDVDDLGLRLPGWLAC